MQTRSSAPLRTLCVNICETAPPSASASDIEQFVAAACAEAGFPHCERIYAGSYFCENYFLGLGGRFYESLRAFCSRHGVAATLVVPITGQAFLARTEERLARILGEFCDVYDEVVVNDAACFDDLARWLAGGPTEPGCGISGRFPHLRPPRIPRIGLGRLFAKELRDPRYEETFGAVARPRLSAEAASCLEIQQHAIPASTPLIELDPTSETLDVSGILAQAAGLHANRARSIGQKRDDSQPTEVPPDFRSEPEIAIHLPYCFATTGRNCGPASIDEPDDQKFRLGRSCSWHCLRIAQGYLVEGNLAYVKHGRTLYYRNDRCRIAGTERWRIVYAAPHETMRADCAAELRSR